MQFRVLGSLEVRDDAGAPVVIVSARQRRLLAALLVHAGAVVSDDRLLDVVWNDDDAPTGGVRTLRTVVSRLRTSLDGAADRGGRLVLTRPPGYVLDLAGAWFDRRTFEEGVAAGLARAAGGDPAGAMAALGDALRLWRGEAFAGFAHEDWARAEAVRLEELRLAAIESRFDAALAVGAHAELVGDIEHVVAEHPLRERPRAQLMLALYRAGRQAEALRAYQTFRAVLADELGLDPSAELQALEAQILARDAAVDGPAAEGRRLRSYRLVAELGRGASGEVWRANQASVDRDVAVKVVRSELANDPAFIRRFEAEAHLVANLEHPHVVPLYDYWRDPSGAYLVMRLLRGGTAAERLRVDGPWSVAAVSQLIDQVGGALAAAHRAGVVHRDVKPSNVLLDEDGNTYLGDFGIAVHDGAVPPAPSRDAPGYAGAADHLVGAAADVRGLAATAFELLTAQSVRHDESPPSLASLRADVPTACGDVLRRAMAAATPVGGVADFVRAFSAAAQNASADVAPSRPPQATPPVDRRANPYKGLRPFDAADAADFFGRDDLVEELVVQLSTQRFVAVVGPSGAGKSSVVRAGLLPRVRAGAVDGSSEWFSIAMVPGSNPFEELEAALLHIAVNPPASLLEQLDGGPRGIARAVKRALPTSGATVLIVLDQFEELYTQVPADVTDRFLDGLSFAAADDSTPLRVVVTLRADFYDRPLADHRLARLFDRATVAVGAMSAPQLEAAIIGPAEAVGVHVENELVVELVAEAQGRPAALPLLQYTLTELFDRSDGSVLTAESYHELGRLSGTIASRAERTYEELDAEGQSAAQLTFGRLVSLGEGVADTRRRTRRADLEAASTGGAAVDVIDRFGRARLLAFDRDPVSRQPTVEIAHEALLRAWPRLRAWIDDDRDVLRDIERVSSAAASWDGGGRDPADLLRGPRLASAVELADAAGARLTETERAFVTGSRDAHDREQIRQRRTTRRLKGLLAGVAALLVVALVSGLVALRQRDAATAARARAEGEALAAEVRRLSAEAVERVPENPNSALLMAVEAYRLRPSTETLGSVQKTLLRLERGWLGSIAGRTRYNAVEFLAGTDLLLVAGSGGADVVDMTTRRIVRTLPFDGDDVTASDVRGATLALGTRRGTWVAYDTATWRELARGAEPREVAELSLDPDARRIAIGQRPAAVTVRDLGDPTAAVSFKPVVAVAGLSWNASGARVLVTGGDTFPARQFDARSGTQVGGDLALKSNTTGSTAAMYVGDRIVLWHGTGVVLDADTGATITKLATVQSGRVVGHVAVVAPDTIVAVGAQSQVERIDLATGKAEMVVPSAGDAAADLAVSSSVAALPQGSHVQLWSLAGDRVLGRAVPSLGNMALITEDGRSLVTSGPSTASGHSVAWDVSGDPRLVRQFDAATYVRARGNEVLVAVRRELEGRFIFEDFVWDPGAGELSSIPGQGKGIAIAIGMSPDGRWHVLPNREDQIVYVTERTTGRVVARLDEIAVAMGPTPTDPFARLLSDAEFTPDSRRLIVPNLTGDVVAVWDTETFTLAMPLLRGARTFRDIDFSADGTKAVTLGGTPEVLQYRDPQTLEPIGSAVLAHNVWNGAGTRVHLSHDGRVIATSGDGGVQLWDAATLTPIGAPFPAASNERWGGEYAPGGEKVAGILGNDVVVWNADIDQWVDIACRAAGRNLTAPEWERFGPVGVARHATCPDYPLPA